MSYTVLVSDQKTLLSIINEAVDEGLESPNVFEMIINILINRGIEKGSFSARYWQIKNVPDYYAINKKIIWDPEIFDLLFNEKIIKSQIVSEGIAHIDRSAKVSRSFISDSCKINGTVENSIIYPGVTIGAGSIVRDSIILPFARIGSGSKILRAIVDERTILDQETMLNIGDDCKIGSFETSIKNTDFPRSLFDSISLVGKDCRIADGARIGGGCYVASGMGSEFGSKKFLYDGMSLYKRTYN
jgi:glucose-1-phosphate adenylyltransferase